jgi:hypothetical protein
MKKQTVFIGIAAGLLVVLSSQQASYAQYGDTGGSAASEQTLKKCLELGISMAQCNDATVLQKERVGWNTQDKGSGTALFASGTGQMIILVGSLGAIFGGVAGGFFVMGRKGKQEKSI